MKKNVKKYASFKDYVFGISATKGIIYDNAHNLSYLKRVIEDVSKDEKRCRKN